MNCISVTASRNYTVTVGDGLLEQLGDYVSQIPGVQKVCIVSDSNVWPLYGNTAVNSLVNHGFRTVNFVFPAGEDSKNGQTYLALLNFLAQQQLTRTDLIVALGGGVVGDLAGFAAATYQRGIPFIQVPTTLLAAVDSSVGGKTAIDLPAGKNLAGAFYQPSAVLCDTACLHTLPEDIFRDGCAEVIKYAILFDAELFAYLLETGLEFDRQFVISRCITHKRNSVAKDEFDTGERRKLNLGHTVGHAVEALSNFTVSHGKAVAIGSAIITRAAAANGVCDPESKDSVLRVLNLFGLPVETQFPSQALFEAALSDKKRSADTVNLIVPVKIGDCKILPLPITQLQTFIEAGL